MIHTSPVHDAGSVREASVSADAQVDSTGLRYTVRDGQLHVSYPHRDAGHGVYGSGFAVGPIPPTYWTAPPNAITRERAALWAALIADDR
jgi:hypothetical protein